MALSHSEPSPTEETTVRSSEGRLIISAVSHLTDAVNGMEFSLGQLAAEVAKNTRAVTAVEHTVDKLRTGADVDRELHNGVQREHREYINKLSHAVRELRERMDQGYSGQPRAELPTLPAIDLSENRRLLAEVAQEEIHRHSDAKDLNRVKWFKNTLKDGVAETIKHISVVILVGALGWMAHLFLGTTPHERRTEPNPVGAPLTVEHHAER